MRYLLLLVTLVAFACNSPAPKNAETTPDIENEYTVKVIIDGMTCTGCENTIESALINIDGVVAADASHEESSAKIALDGSEIDSLIVKKALSDAGYTYVSIENME